METVAVPLVPGSATLIVALPGPKPGVTRTSKVASLNSAGPVPVPDWPPAVPVRLAMKRPLPAGSPASCVVDVAVAVDVRRKTAWRRVNGATLPPR